MSLGTFSNNANTSYLRIGMGKDDKDRPRAVIARKAKKGEPGAVQVLKKGDEPAMDKDGNEVYRTEHAFVEGAVVKMNRREVSYNGQPQQILDLHIVDAQGVLYTLQLDRGDQYWGDLAYRLDNIDFGKPCRFQPFSIPKESDSDKRNRYLVVYQEGKKVEKKWNKDSTDGPPEVTFDPDEKKYLWGKRNNWLDQNPIQQAIDRVAFLAGVPDPNTPPPLTENDVPGEGIDMDDII